jgi:hypothetical protein
MNNTEKVRQVNHGGKKAPLITFVSALIAFILSLVALLSPGNGSLQNQDLVTVRLQLLYRKLTLLTIRVSSYPVKHFHSCSKYNQSRDQFDGSCTRSCANELQFC